MSIPLAHMPTDCYLEGRREVWRASLLRAVHYAVFVDRGKVADMRLALIKSGTVQSTFPISDSDLVIGRDESCDIVLDDPRVSKKHARISHLEGQLAVADMESSNRTRINERTILTQILRVGDILRIGRTIFLCLADKMPEPPADRPKYGWLVGKLPAQDEIHIPIGQIPILIGTSPEATVRVMAKGVKDFQMQIIAVPGGFQLNDMGEKRVRCALLRHGESFRVGSARFVFRATESKQALKDTKPVSLNEKEKSSPAKSTNRRPTETQPMEDPEEAFSPGTQQEWLHQLLQDEAEYAETAEPTSNSRKPPAPFRGGAFQLTALSGPCSGQVFGLTGQRVLIGRDEECDIYLNDESTSREHAIVERVEGDMVIEDLRSSNGVLLNGRRIRRHPLKTGDKIQIGITEFLVHL